MFENTTKDFSYYSGERQTGFSLSEIRADHLNRYEFVVEFIKKNFSNSISVLDIFCGNGYGTYLLSNSYPNIDFIGIDGSGGAIDCAEQYFSLQNNAFQRMVYPFTLTSSFDLIICFESIEHVDDDSSLSSLLKQSTNKNGYLIVSVPNENKHSLSLNPHPFHHRHYKFNEVLSLFQPEFKLITWYGQNVYEFHPNGVCTHRLIGETKMCLKHQKEGQINLFIFRKII